MCVGESDVADGHLGDTDASVDSAPSAMNYIVQRDVVSDQVESDTANRQQLLHSTDNTVIIGQSTPSSCIITYQISRLGLD